MFEETAALEAQGKFVPRDRSEVPDGEKVHNAVWAFDHKKDMESLELLKRKVRPSFDGRTEVSEGCFSAPATVFEFLCSVAVAVALRRFVAASDFGKAYTETMRPNMKSKWMHMLQGFVRYDASGKAKIYELPFNMWGERAGGRVFEDHKNDAQKQLGMSKAGDAVNIWTKPVGGGLLTSTNVVDDFLITSDDRGALDEHRRGLESKFAEVKWRDYPTSFDGYKLVWVVASDQRPISCTVSNPFKVMQLVEMLGGVDVMKARIAGRRVTRELLEAAAIPDEELSEKGQLVQRGIGVLQWVSPIRVDVKFALHHLSRAMRAPSDAAAVVLDLTAVSLYETAHDGLTFKVAHDSVVLEGAYRAIRPDFKMAKGSPAAPTLAYDATWGEPGKSIGTCAFTYAGAAVDAATVAIPGPMMSSCQAELWAASWALARGVYVLGVIVALGGTVKDKVQVRESDRVPILGDNSMAVDLVAGDASAKAMRHTLRRIAFAQECASADGDFISLKVPDEDNPTDCMGKLVSKDKVNMSMRWLMGKHHQPPIDVLEQKQ